MYMHLTQEPQIYEAKIDKTKGRNEQIYNYSWRLNLPFSVINKTSAQKIIKDIKTQS